MQKSLKLECKTWLRLGVSLTNESIMNKDIIELKKEIDRLQDIALKQFEDKRVPNAKNHERLVKLRKQLERLLKEER